jgi:BirA family biotin operon repressor/biotin-[acetyl-CoA-carboxylase] ligase
LVVRRLRGEFFILAAEDAEGVEEGRRSRTQICSSRRAANPDDDGDSPRNRNGDTDLGTERRLVGRKVLRYKTIDSTNNVAATYAGDPTHNGLVVLADEQTAGRGRLGRRWVCPPASSVLLSTLLFPPDALRRPALFTVLAGVAVCETLYDLASLQATLKWPNDVLIRGKKVGGILVESKGLSFEMRAAASRPANVVPPPKPGIVIGIGLNVNVPAEHFLAVDLGHASSLAVLTGRQHDRDAIAERLLHHLDDGYADLLEGRFEDLVARWRWHSGLLGRHVVMTTGEGTHVGRLVEMNFDGLTMVKADGQSLTVPPEAVEQLTARRTDGP